MENDTSLVSRCHQMLSENGHLSSTIPGFVARTQQLDLAVAIAESINNQSILVAEAGTGTGKTFAYLVPCLLSGKKSLISTATKTLQDQLFQKDLPKLLGVLGLSFRIQNLKGRANYVCRYRVELHAEEGRFSDTACVDDFSYIREKLSQLHEGERNELPDIREDSLVWPYVTSTADNCLGSECSYFSNCFLMKARKKALEADVVVINHHLFFADSRLKEDGLSSILPGVEIVIFDEAHQLSEIATHFYSDRMSTRQCRDLMDDLLNEYSAIEESYLILQDLSRQLDINITNLLSHYSSNNNRCSWIELNSNKYFMIAWKKFVEWLDNLLLCLKDVNVKERPGLEQCIVRLQDLKNIINLFESNNTDKIYWSEIYKHTLVFHATPYDVCQPFQDLIHRQQAAYVFTSATLTMANSFNCFINSLGLIKAKTLFLPSPFNFKQQALLYLPRSLPDPNQEHYYDALITRVLPVINAFGGRCFFLFTSHRALQLVANQLSLQIKFPVLVQGEDSKPILLARFRELGNAVLLGTSTFWEGVDVIGETLSCVIIDKLPFASPFDPIMKARMDYFKSKGLSAFDELSLPNAVLALKQGVGRLIRDVSDRGVVMIADPRLTSREYGRLIFASLPPMLKTRDEKKVINFIKNLSITL